MNRYLKYAALAYLSVIAASGFAAVQLHAAGHLRGDYVAEIRKEPVQKGNRAVRYYSLNKPVRQPVFTIDVPGIRGADHGLFIESGKTIIYKECTLDSIQDPVGNSCVMIWMYL